MVFCLAALALVCGTGYSQGTARGQRFVTKHPWPGGVDPRPVITAAAPEDGLRLEWFGLKGPYQVQTTPSLNAPNWVNVGAAEAGLSAKVAMDSTMGFFRVNGPIPAYAGVDTCVDCHESTHGDWVSTRHALAFETLKNIGQHKNSDCLGCHTVGFGIPGGYISEEATPLLKAVQCENCHGPSAEHAANPFNLNLRPVKSPSAALCGGCHNGFHHPTFDEWKTAGHAHVTPATANYFLGADGASRMLSCGACHSGAVRMSMLRGDPLPPPADAAEVSVTCTVCHNAHGNTGFARQLRNPVFSTNFFSYSTGTNTTFAAQYDAGGGKNVNMCGQCHNQRGALPTDWSRPPHHSVQYNLLIGQTTAASAPLWALQKNAQVRSAHTMIQAQCTHCHTHAHPVADPTEEHPTYTGHSFKPFAENCLECHQTVERVETAVAQTQTEIKRRIQEVKAKLDLWGRTKAPEPLRVKYAALAWEYNNAGQISNPTGSSAIKGPGATEHASLPDKIKESRFYLYMVEHDGSYGVHNGKYARFLLDAAEAQVDELLKAP